MTPEELETVYEALAQAIDAAGPERRELLLAKLSLLLAERVGDAEAVRGLIDAAARNLDV